MDGRATSTGFILFLPGFVVKTKNQSVSISQKMKLAKFRPEQKKMMHAVEVVHLLGRFMIVISYRL